jgi:hypothetical protein
MERLFVAPIAPGEEWRPGRVLIEFGEEVGRLIEQIDAVEAIWLKRRRSNREALYRFAGQHGLKAGRPPLEDRTASEEKRLITAWAELDVARLCESANASPQTMRMALKASRNKIDNCAIYESEIRIYLRAKNRMISRLLTWLQDILGPEDCPVAERGFVVEPDEAELQAARESAEPYSFVVGLECRPRAPELAPDALPKAYERWLIDDADKWLPDEVLRPVLGRAPLCGPDVSEDEVKIVKLLRHIAREAVQGRESVDTLEDLALAVQAISDAPQGRGQQRQDSSVWRELCEEIVRVIRSERVRTLASEGGLCIRNQTRRPT